MNGPFVVDSSVALTWLFPDEITPRTEELFHRITSQTFVVPDWWFVELTNVMAVAEKKGRITAEHSSGFIADLSAFDIDIDTAASSRAFAHLLPLCRAHGLTSYDAIYLDLALRRQLPLATLDQALRKAAKKAGVKVLG